MSVCCVTSLSVILPAPSLSIIPICPSYEWSVHPPVTLSRTCQSATPPVSPVKHPSPSNRLYTILPHLPGCLTLSDHTSIIYTSPSDHPPQSHHLYNTPISPSACPSPADCLTTTTTRPPIHPSTSMIHHTQDSIQSLAVLNGEQSHMIHHTQDSSQSIAVVNGEQFCQAKKFHRAFTNYDILLCALDASNIYLHDSKRVAPPKPGEDAHVTCGRCDFG